MRICFSLSMSCFSRSRKEERVSSLDRTRRLLNKDWQRASAGESSDSSHPFLLRFRNLISESPLIEAVFVLSS